jgi:hypothetical protein
VVTTAILGRLLHHSHVITSRGDSYEKTRTDLLKVPAIAPTRQHRGNFSAHLPRGLINENHKVMAELQRERERTCEGNAPVRPQIRL